MDFLDYFGLKDDPFRLTPDPEYFYPAESHNLGLKSLEYSVEQAEGFCVITGEPGTGKTTLLNVFMKKWKEKAAIALILTPRLMPEEFLSSVLEDFGLDHGTDNKNELIKKFRDFLLEKSSTGKRVIIIVDEAQNLPVETLEELRLLSNLETEKQKLLQIILVGQPELEKKLQSVQLRQLSQRITTRVRLQHLSFEETREYVNYRLLKAGKTFLRFEDTAIKKIYKLSTGVPRLINILALRALMGAYIEGTNILKKRHIEQARKSLDTEGFSANLPDSSQVKKRTSTYVFAALSVVILVSVIFYALRYFDIGEKVAVSTSISEPEKGEAMHKTEGSPTRLAVITVDAANIRAAPDIDAERIGVIMKEKQVQIYDEITDESGNKWYRIEFFGDKDAWISESVVNVVQTGE